MAGEPVLDKAEASPSQDYHLLTWDYFLRLRAWATRVAEAEGYPLYLVGSCLYKTEPRDIDVSIIVPHDAFVARFGTIPPNAITAEEHADPHRMPAYMDRLRHYLTFERPYKVWALEAELMTTRLDLKICPDSWWTDQDKLPLALPHELKG